MNNYFRLINTDQAEKKIASGNFPFRQNLFWDTEVENISLKNNSRYIIERVLTRGFLEDFYILTRLYSAEEIKDALRKSKELDAKTVHFCSHYFKIPLSEMYVSPYYS
jgi:hypothetical protein